MKKTILLISILLLVLVAALGCGVAYADDGDLDPTFDADGRVTTEMVLSGWNYVKEVAIQPDGKIVAVGYAGSNNISDFAVARYNPDGSLDLSFDGDGKVLTDFFGGSDDQGLAMALLADGKIVVAGSTRIGQNYDFALARYNPDGSLDYSFGGDGRVTTAFGSNSDWATSVAVQPDGKIVAAGAGILGGDFALARYNADGSLDDSFSGDGKVTTDFGGAETANAIGIQADGKIVTAGQVDLSGPLETAFALARYNADGSLDADFGNSGKVITGITASNILASGMAIQPDGKIVAVGFSYFTYKVVLARYNPNGGLDSSFDGDGIVVTDLGGDDDAGFAVALQSDGKIVVAGQSDVGGTQDFALIRYNLDGSLDPTFGGDGWIITDFAAVDDAAQAIAIQPDGKIIAGGFARGTSSVGSFALARYESSGPTPTATPTPPSGCSIQFPDVPPGSTFYEYVRCLACRNIISGYADGTFRPSDSVTRGQFSKIVSNAAGFIENHAEQSFEDVPGGSTFHLFVERLFSRGYVSGYACGGPGEPCGIGNLPYFRPNANVTRGQTAKIVSNAANISDPPGSQAFEDVPPGSTFFDFVQRLANRGVMSGYACGGPGEPCGSGNRPYFRPNTNVTRGQAAKIVANTFFPGCVTP